MSDHDFAHHSYVASFDAEVQLFLDALGITDKRITAVTIDLSAGSLMTVNVERLVTHDELAALTAALKAAPPRKKR